MTTSNSFSQEKTNNISARLDIEYPEVLAAVKEYNANADDLLVPFAKAVFKMLKKEKVISLAVINNMSTWQHSGFNIHCGFPVSFSDADAIERLARYIIRAPISQERLKYIPNNKSESGICFQAGAMNGGKQEIQPSEMPRCIILLN